MDFLSSIDFEHVEDSFSIDYSTGEFDPEIEEEIQPAKKTKRIKIYGPPGCGKTKTLIDIVTSSIREGLYLPGEIGFLTYSRSAANEARARAKKQFPNIPYEQFKYFGTIHSLANKLLDLKKANHFNEEKAKEFNKETGYLISDNSEEDGGGGGGQFIDRANLTMYDKFLSILDYCKNTGKTFSESHERFEMPWDRYKLDEEMYNVFVEKYERFKQFYHPRLYDFVDLLTEALEVNIFPRFRLLIIDEAQDLSKLHWALIEKWLKNVDTVIISGDAYQAIYEFQGACPELMMNWRADHEITLNRSFRCPDAIYNMSREIVKKFQERYDDRFIPSGIKGLVSERNFDFENVNLYDDIFLLTRTNKQVNRWAYTFRAFGIPYGYIRGRKAILDCKRARVFLALKRLKDDKNTSLQDIKDLLEFMPSKGNLEKGAKAKIKRIVDDEEEPVFFYRQDLRAYGFLESCLEAIKTGDIVNKLKDYPENLHRFYQCVFDRYGIKGFEAKKPPILLGTIHSAKGKEARTVIIDSEVPKIVKTAIDNEEETEDRLAYVAITRAKEEVIILEREIGSVCYPYPDPEKIVPEEFSDIQEIDRDFLIRNILGLRLIQNDEFNSMFEEEE